MVLIIYTILLYVFDALFSQALGFINYAILLVGIIWGTLVFRDKHNDGELSYGGALGTGVLISLFAFILVGIFSYILYQFIDPDLINKSIIATEEKMLERGMPADQIEQFTDMQRKNSSPLKNSLLGIPLNTFFGFIISLITSIFLKKEKAPFEGENQ